MRCGLRVDQKTGLTLPGCAEMVFESRPSFSFNLVSFVEEIPGEEPGEVLDSTVGLEIV